MKSILYCCALIAVCSLISCSGNDSKNQQSTTSGTFVPPAQRNTPTTQAPSTQQFPTATQNNAQTQAFGLVQHYTCSNNCAGSGSADPGNCPVCGSQYVHNTAYHNQGTTAQTNPTAAPPPSPAQNAAGVYHYTCSNGCEGGSGAAGTCAKCGGQLAHNTAYH